MPRHRARARGRGELDGLLRSEASRQGEREAGGEGVAGAVGVGERSRERRRRPATLLPVRDVPTTVGALGRDDEPRLRIEVTRLVPLGEITRAVDERVELNAGRAEESGARARSRPGRGRAAPRVAPPGRLR